MNIKQVVHFLLSLLFLLIANKNLLLIFNYNLLFIEMLCFLLLFYGLNQFAISSCDEYTYLFNNIEDDIHTIKETDFGQLTGDVQNWGAIIQNYILQVLFFYKFKLINTKLISLNKS